MIVEFARAKQYRHDANIKTMNSSPTLSKSEKPKTPATRHGKGTIVKGLNNGRIYQVCSVADWKAPEYAVPAKYNLCDYATGQIETFNVADISPLQGTELRPIQERVKAKEIKTQDGIRAKEYRKLKLADLEFDKRLKEQQEINRLRITKLMSTLPKRTRMLGKSIIGRAANDMNLAKLIDVLIPKYRVTHCWGCKTDLNNLEYNQCPNCGWIKCPCGKCSDKCDTS